tara:strand:+ start:3483 stop:3953 length:471 start_codon:yes stop_codon:yes gene_type:complete
LAPCAARHRRSSSVVSRNIQPIKRPSLARVSPPPRLHRSRASLLLLVSIARLVPPVADAIVLARRVFVVFIALVVVVAIVIVAIAIVVAIARVVQSSHHRHSSHITRASTGCRYPKWEKTKNGSSRVVTRVTMGRKNTHPVVFLGREWYRVWSRHG